MTPLASQIMPKRFQRSASRGDSARLANASRAAAETSGATSPRVLIVGGWGAAGARRETMTAATTTRRRTMTPPMMGVRRERAAGAAAFASSTLRRPRGGWGLAARGIETIVPRVCPEPQPAPSPRPAPTRSPLELGAEPGQPRRHDRHRQQERRARSPGDVRTGVRVGQVVGVEEQRHAAAAADLNHLLDAGIEQHDVVLLPRGDRLGQDALRAVVHRHLDGAAERLPLLDAQRRRDEQVPRRLVGAMRLCRPGAEYIAPIFGVDPVVRVLYVLTHAQVLAEVGIGVVAVPAVRPAA